MDLRITAKGRNLLIQKKIRSTNEVAIMYMIFGTPDFSMNEKDCRDTAGFISSDVNKTIDKLIKDKMIKRWYHTSKFLI